MKKIITGILVCFSAISFANVEVNGPLDTKMFNKEVNESKSYYETLGEMFQSGSKPEASKLLGVMWSGRCFTSESEYEPVNGAYHFKRKSNQDVGPLGDANISYEASSIWKRSASPSYFDDKDISQFTRKTYYRVFDSENSVAIKYSSGDMTGISKLKFSGKYLVEEVSETKSDVGPLGDGDNFKTTIRCYYFIPEYSR
jgi:hypothetical protein